MPYIIEPNLKITISKPMIYSSKYPGNEVEIGLKKGESETEITMIHSSHDVIIKGYVMNM